MRNPQLFYQPSGRFNPLIVASFIGIVPIAVILGFIYSYGAIWIPIIGIVSLLLLLAFAFAMGMVTAGACNIFKVRSRLVGVLFGLIVGLITLHASWATFIFAFFQRFVDGETPGFFAIYFNPLAMWSVTKEIYASGWFSIGRSSDATISGIALGILWVLEAVVLVGGPIMGGIYSAGEVFCERCGAWTDDEVGIATFRLSQGIVMASKINEQGFAALAEMEPEDPGTPDQCRLDVSVCSKCRKLFALTLTSIENTVNSKGESEVKTKDLVKNLLVTEEQYLHVKNGTSAEGPAAEPV